MATLAILDSYDGVISLLHQLPIGNTRERRNKKSNHIGIKWRDLELIVMFYLCISLLDPLDKMSKSRQEAEKMSVGNGILHFQVLLDQFEDNAKGKH
ncbi:hypothetical protein BgiBS90_010204 [Biomphalaria glabrata]|nr:hypothetical protein BgiBS90_010204 [Biomphalaria glabrata]